MARIVQSFSQICLAKPSWEFTLSHAGTQLLTTGNQMLFCLSMTLTFNLHFISVNDLNLDHYSSLLLMCHSPVNWRNFGLIFDTTGSLFCSTGESHPMNQVIHKARCDSEETNASIFDTNLLGRLWTIPITISLIDGRRPPLISPTYSSSCRKNNHWILNIFVFYLNICWPTAQTKLNQNNWIAFF